MLPLLLCVTLQELANGDAACEGCLDFLSSPLVAIFLFVFIRSFGMYVCVWVFCIFCA